mgnify:CR=1 FL=1
MKLQTLKLRLMRITFYTIQKPSEIMHNLYPNSRNYLGRSFSHILKYLQTSSLPNIPNCNTTYQLPYLRFINLYLWIQRYKCLLDQTISLVTLKIVKNDTKGENLGSQDYVTNLPRCLRQCNHHWHRRNTDRCHVNKRYNWWCTNGNSDPKIRQKPSLGSKKYDV